MEEYERESRHQSGGNQCIMPQYDDHDPRFLKYMRPFPPINCGKTQPYLTFMDNAGYIHRNSSSILALGLNDLNIRCFYKEIERVEFDDDSVKLSRSVEFKNTTLIKSDFLLAECRKSDNAEIIHRTFHSQIPYPASKGLNARKSGPSILILTFDSLSRINFLNQLPKTYNFLEKNLKSYIFKGLTKTGDNTYPNTMSFLSGLAGSPEDYGDYVPQGIPFWGPKSSRIENFDNVPLVWKNFSRAGYVTMFAEDMPKMSAFNYLAKGFFRKPTDYYMRPYWLAFEKFGLFQSSDSRCGGNFPVHEYMFNYTEEFARKMSNVSYFALSFLSVLSHDYLNSVQVADNDIVSFLARLWSSGVLKDTVTIVMGDHGNRFDSIRVSDIGRIEERLPFFSVSLPESLHQSHTHLHEGMLSNEKTLMSWFDVYELFMDFAMDNLGPVSRVRRWGAVGLSPLRTLPKNRTCLEIGIPRMYCPCGDEKDLDTEERRVVEAAEALKDHINGLIEASADGYKCSRLGVKKILSAQLLLPSSPLAIDFVVETRVSIELFPGGVQLEGLLQRNAWSKNGGRVTGDVNRINRYGNQSHCITDVYLKKYCFCKDLFL
ncbi:uncharacterized protein [Hetaerina americana]|uniref:uncharacterized protein n=1 Tax=Hetaerina americana TaxID=62018 RepID=UPI003A7F2042